MLLLQLFLNFSKQLTRNDLFSLIESNELITQELLYYLINYNTDKLEESLCNLVSKKDTNILHSMVYVHNSYYPYNIQRNSKDICDLIYPIAKKVSFEYRRNRYQFKTKLLLKNARESLEIKNNADTILQLALSGEKKGVKVFLTAIEKGILRVEEHKDTLFKLGKMGYPLAYGILGELYLSGHSVVKDISLAKEYFKKGSEKNEPMSLHGMGLIAMEEENDIELAKKYFIKAIHKGSVAANYSFYLCNEKVLKNNLIGITYLTAAASKGYIPAMFKHSEILINSGRYMEALSYLIAISKYSFEITEINELAEINYFKKNYVKALSYYLILTETGSYSAIENALYLINDKKVIKNDELIFYLLVKYLNNGIFTHLVELGDCYFYGRGTEQNYKIAFSYYLSASLYGNFKGIYCLSYMYFKGFGCQKDVIKSVKYLFRAIEFDSNGYVFVIYLVPFYIIFSLVESVPYKDIIVTFIFTVIFVAIYEIKRRRIIK